MVPLPAPTKDVHARTMRVFQRQVAARLLDDARFGSEGIDVGGKQTGVPQLG